MRKNIRRRRRGYLRRRFISYIIRFIIYIRRTWKNKGVSLLGIAAGFLSAVVAEGDITALLLFLMIFVPLFFAKENWIQ